MFCLLLQLHAERAKTRHLRDRVEDLEVQLERARDRARTLTSPGDRLSNRQDSPLQLRSVLRALESRRQHAPADGSPSSPASSTLDQVSLGKFFSPAKKMPSWGLVGMDSAAKTPTTPFAQSAVGWPVMTLGSVATESPLAQREESAADQGWAALAAAFQNPETAAPHRVLTDLFRDGALSPHALLPPQQVPIVGQRTEAESNPWLDAALAGWIAPESPLLHIAVAANHKRAIKAILRAGVNINALDVRRLL